jgi:hypothetical protein
MAFIFKVAPIAAAALHLVALPIRNPQQNSVGVVKAAAARKPWIS